MIHRDTVCSLQETVAMIIVYYLMAPLSNGLCMCGARLVLLLV